MKASFKTFFFSKKAKKVSFLLLAFLCGSILTSFYEGGVVKNKLLISSFPTVQYENFSLTYDSRNKIPLWTYERLTEVSLSKTASRNHCLFSQDPTIYSLHQSSLNDYQNSGFDKGHMVPAADQQYSKEALKNTFYLTNICPQKASLNRGIWASLERKARKDAKENKEIEVVTGPLFLPYTEGNKRFVTYQVIGKNDVAVPTHFFKLIKSRKETIAYIIPNESIDSQTNLESFEVSIETLEKVSGLHFEFNK